MASLGEQFGRYMFSDIVDWISSNLDPDEVFDQIQLSDWAKENGYIEDTQKDCE